MVGEENIPFQLVLWSTFAVLGLPGPDQIETHRAMKVMPLMPLFLGGNSTSQWKLYTDNPAPYQ